MFAKLSEAVMGAVLPRADGSFCLNQCAKHSMIQTLMSLMQTFSHSQLLCLRVTNQSIITGKTTAEREGGSCGH